MWGMGCVVLEGSVACLPRLIEACGHAGWCGGVCVCCLGGGRLRPFADIQPRHRFMSAYEQRIEAPNKDFQYVFPPSPPPALSKSPDAASAAEFSTPRLAALPASCCDT